MNQPNRNAAYGVIVLIILLLLAMFWPSGSPTPTQALAQPIIVTPTHNPAFTPRPAMPRDVPPMLATDAPVAEVAVVVATPEPIVQEVYVEAPSAPTAEPVVIVQTEIVVVPVAASHPAPTERPVNASDFKTQDPTLKCMFIGCLGGR